MYSRSGTVAALVRNLERPSERLDDSAEKRGGNRKRRHGMGCLHEKGKRTRPRNPGHVDHLAEQGRHSISQERKIIRLERRDPCKPIDRRGVPHTHNACPTKTKQTAPQTTPSFSAHKSRSNPPASPHKRPISRSTPPPPALAVVDRSP